MFQCRGMVLERGKTVGHGWIAGIAGFGKQAEIGQLQCFYQVGTFHQFWGMCTLAEMAVQQHDHDTHDLQCRESDENSGFAHQMVTISRFIPEISG